MKIAIVTMAFLASLLFGGASPIFAEEAEKSCTLDIAGMTCGSCEKQVEKALMKTPGVKSAEADLTSKSATVVYSDGTTTPEKLAQAVTKAGYEAKVRSEKK